jgi:hypothetical protein
MWVSKLKHQGAQSDLEVLPEIDETPSDSDCKQKDTVSIEYTEPVE